MSRNRTLRRAAGAAVLAAAAAGHAQSADITRTQAAGGAAPIAQSVSVPAGFDLIFVSGATGQSTDPAHPGDTHAQALAVLAKHKATLQQLGLSFADVVEAHVFLVGDPAKGGEIDFAGLNAAWSTVFGSDTQPNKPARSTVKVAGLVAPNALVEIEFVAARHR